VLAALAMAAAVTLIPLAVASADAGGNASCVGHEASGISPPGSSAEFPGGVPELKAALETFFPDVPLGSLVRIVAAEHRGSHEACDQIEL
jgi:hypothetical protein